jgi:peptide/nickel transport system substrate-binding protein
MKKKSIAIAAIFIIALSGLTGCGETTNFLTGSTEQSVNTVRSDEVYIPIEKIRTLNPIVTKDEDAYYVDKLIYESMFGFDKNLALTNVLADNYSYAPDGTSLTVNLKHGIYWQDGEELTAEDVKFTIDTISAAVYTSGTLYASNISNVKYTKLDNKDPYQITIYFTSPQNVSLANLTFPIIPRHQFKNTDAARTAESDFIPIGTGPYKVADYNELSHVILTGNENYHGSEKPTNKLNFQIIMQNMLRPIVEAAGYRVVSEADEYEVDLAILSEASSGDLTAARIIRLRAEPDPASAKDDSIYRYDRAALLTALKSAGAGRR